MKKHEQQLWLFRAMISDGKKPLLGDRGSTLGVRRDVDVPVTADGTVFPGTGGLSVAPGDPKYLPPHRKPAGLGGRGRDPVFRINCDSLPNTLSFAQDSPTHGMVEPGMVCAFEEYQENLHGTRDDWERVQL